MEKDVYKAFVVREKDGQFNANIETKKTADLPQGDLLIKVSYSSLNYKDALSASGNKGVTRSYPHTPGIDAVGTVQTSDSNAFKPGDKLIVTSYDLGMNTHGGFAEYIRVPAHWAVRLPQDMTMKEAMIIGTAGLTAGMSVQRLAALVNPEHGDVIVSGATGGVGAHSVAILNKLGYSVVALTGKENEKDYLKNLGAKRIILRKDFEVSEKRPLLKPAFAGGIDTVGGSILDNMIKSTQPMGAVACCGNAASAQLNLTVFPFILRGVALIGIDSQNYPMHQRQKVWNKLACDWKPEALMNNYDEIKLEQVPEKLDLMLKGQLKGRTIVNLAG
ncbi:putative quinone oxidoreductase, YhdH/YhfP family [Saccharicrinis carchari]|uniref:Putative quinone oxidoreductase, YhdH/YhfP family n=1 Tax=Saccharicrinis carchari TaxID=1168039 RepID=A0A521D5J5_SACCC|nr:YhdH/YhfP family quinone oxidoreductase [Saccharicrinis carchari]SMO66959.1 putative quinone oxidoreductase, YhdH/YhfP family [Saccharicrinis carchari]